MVGLKVPKIPCLDGIEISLLRRSFNYVRDLVLQFNDTRLLSFLEIRAAVGCLSWSAIYRPVIGA